MRNQFRVTVFRTWLIDTFGEARLRAGAGVLDVAGGKGELAFELSNLSGIPATVCDPRPLQLSGFVRRLRLGVYHRNALNLRYNTAFRDKVCPHPRKTPNCVGCSLNGNTRVHPMATHDRRVLPRVLPLGEHVCCH